MSILSFLKPKSKRNTIKESINEYNLLLYDFLTGVALDDKERHIDEIWGYDYDELERCHDYIQWIFPTNEASRHNKHCPVLTDDMIAKFAIDSKIKDSLIHSLSVMLDFYGFTLLDENNPRIVKSFDYLARSVCWVNKYNHNFLRITRILKSLTLLGLGEYAKSFYAALYEVYQAHPDCISSTTISYWKSAAGMC